MSNTEEKEVKITAIHSNKSIHEIVFDSIFMVLFTLAIFHYLIKGTEFIGDYFGISGYWFIPVWVVGFYLIRKFILQSYKH